MLPHLSDSMNAVDALHYAKGNYQALLNSNRSIVGVTYTLDTPETEFHIIQIKPNKKDHDDGLEWFDVLIKGGYIPDNGYSNAQFLGGDDVREVLNKLPPFASTMRYLLYQDVAAEIRICNERYLTETAYLLKQLFPELPNPDNPVRGDFSFETFKRQAIKMIDDINIDDISEEL